MIDPNSIKNGFSSFHVPEAAGESQELKAAAAKTNQLLEMQEEHVAYWRQPCWDHHNPRAAFPDATFAPLSIQRKVREELTGFPLRCTLWDTISFRVYKIGKENLLANEPLIDDIRRLYIQGYPLMRVPRRCVEVPLNNLKSAIHNGCERLRKSKLKCAAARVQQLQKAIFLLDFARTYYYEKFCAFQPYIYSIPDAFAEKSNESVGCPNTMVEFCEFCLSIFQSLDFTSDAISGLIDWNKKVIQEQYVRTGEFLYLTLLKEEETETLSRSRPRLHVELHEHLAYSCLFWMADLCSIHISCRRENIISCMFLCLNLQRWQEKGQNPLIDSSRVSKTAPPLEEVNKFVAACRELNGKIGKEVVNCNLTGCPFLWEENESIFAVYQKLLENYLGWFRTWHELGSMIDVVSKGMGQLSELLQTLPSEIRSWLSTKPDDQRDHFANKISIYILQELFQILPYLLGLGHIATYISIEHVVPHYQEPIPPEKESSIFEYLIAKLDPTFVDLLYLVTPEMLLKGLAPYKCTMEEITLKNSETKELPPEEREIPLSFHSKLREIFRVINKIGIEKARITGGHLIIKMASGETVVIPTHVRGQDDTLPRGTMKSIMEKLKQ